VIATVARRRRLTVRALPSTVLYSSLLTVACLVSYLLITRALDLLHSVSRTDDYLGGMWATVATVFVYRIGYRGSVMAAASRSVATALSLALCLIYLLLFPFSPVGLAVLVGLGTAILILAGRDGDIITTGITTAVVLVVAALAPDTAWQQPILRLVDTAVGIAVGLLAARLARVADRRMLGDKT